MSLDRRILVPCEEWTPAAALYASRDSDGERQERGPQPGIAVRDDAAKGNVDARMVRFPGIPLRRHLDAEVQVHVSGDIEKGRWLWKRKTEPYWKGKSDFCDFAQTVMLESQLDEYYRSPTTLAMSNGELLVLYALNFTSDTTNTDWYWVSRVYTPTGGVTERAYLSLLPVQVDRGAILPAFPAICAAEDPNNPGHITAVGFADASNDGTVISNYDLLLFTSRDYGRTWRQTQFIPAFTGASNHAYGASAVYAGARLVVAVNRATDNVGIWYSNDHGQTWTAATQSSVPVGLGGGVSLVRAANGALLLFKGTGGGSSNNLGVMWSGDNGASWQGFTDPAIDVVNGAAADNGYWPAAFVDDAGFVGVYWVSFLTGTPNRNGLYFARAPTRAITLADVTKATNIFDDATEERTRWRNQVVLEYDNSVQANSLYEVAVANWRGRVAVVQNYLDAQSKCMLLSFANLWTDLRYEAYPSLITAYPAWEYAYLPTRLPTGYGTLGFAWTATGAPASSFFPVGGGLGLASTGSAFSYTSPALALDPHVVRFMVRLDSGGSVTADDVYIEAAGATNDWRWRLRLASTGFQLRDANGANNIGPAVSSDLTQWHEFVVVVQTNEDIQMYWRKLDRQADEHPATNETIATATKIVTTTPEATSQIKIGHGAISAVSEWGQIVWRPKFPAPPASMVDRWDPDDPWQTWSATLQAFFTSDVGPEVSELPAHLADGSALAMSGAGALSGDSWELETRPSHGLALACEGGPSRGWMADASAVATGDAISAVFDAGVDRKFRADALALFGCNLPKITVMMNDADYWATGTPPVEVAVDFSGAPLRQEKIRSATPSVAMSRVVASVDGNAVGLTAASLRPHMFRGRGARTWYCGPGAGETNEGHVWRVVDNSEDALFLSEAPDGRIVVGDDLVVYSNQYLLDLSQVASLDGSVGYRFLRVAANGLFVLHDGAEGPRAGRIILGRMSRIVDPEWGFSVRTTPGVSLVRGAGGQVRASRTGPDLDSYVLSWPPRPPEGRDRDCAPASSAWQRIRDLLYATRLGLDNAVLVPDGKAMDDAAYQRACGEDLALVRAVGVLSLTHEAYLPVEAISSDFYVGAFMGVGGLVFEEEA